VNDCTTRLQCCQVVLHLLGVSAEGSKELMSQKQKASGRQVSKTKSEFNQSNGRPVDVQVLQPSKHRVLNTSYRSSLILSSFAPQERLISSSFVLVISCSMFFCCCVSLRLVFLNEQLPRNNRKKKTKK